MRKATGEVKREGIVMTVRENESYMSEGDEPEERESNFLDNPDFIELDEEWQAMIEQSIIEEG